MKIENKIIVITGASSGIGKELLKKLPKNNTIIAASRNIEKIPGDTNIIKIKCDISKKEDIDNLIEQIYKRFNKIDIFFSNAGFAYYEKFKNKSYEDIEYIFKTNVFSNFYILEEIIKRNKENQFNFVITASAMSFNALPGYALYSATKYSLKGFFDAFKYELIKGQNINMVYPIATLTEFFNTAGTKNIPWPRQSAEKVAEKIIRGIMKNKKEIFPSNLFKVMLFINKFFPVFYIYNKIEAKKFKRLGE